MSRLTRIKSFLLQNYKAGGATRAGRVFLAIYITAASAAAVACGAAVLDNSARSMAVPASAVQRADAAVSDAEPILDTTASEAPAAEAVPASEAAPASQAPASSVPQPVAVASVTLSKRQISLTTGDTKQLSASVAPDDAADPSLSWKSDDTGVATVNTKGVVTAKSAGTAHITASAGSHSDTATVTVSDPTPTPAPAPSQAPATQPAAGGGSIPQVNGLASEEAAVVELVNQQRAANNLPALNVNSTLTSLARLKSKDMIDKNYFAHESPDYGTPDAMFDRFGVDFTYQGENIAYGQTSAAQVMNDWMNSSGHKANILNSHFTEIGVGAIKNSSGIIYWTQEFRAP